MRILKAGRNTDWRPGELSELDSTKWWTACPTPEVRRPNPAVSRAVCMNPALEKKNSSKFTTRFIPRISGALSHSYMLANIMCIYNSRLVIASQYKTLHYISCPFYSWEHQSLYYHTMDVCVYICDTMWHSYTLIVYCMLFVKRIYFIYNCKELIFKYPFFILHKQYVYEHFLLLLFYNGYIV
jgi:hypothetical protein